MLALSFALAACGSATEAPVEALNEVGPRDASYDGALEFDGVDDYASLGTARAPHIKRDQTVMLWFRSDGAVPGGAARQVLFTLNRADDSGFAIALEGAVPFVFNVYGERDLARAEGAVSFGEWHHLAFVIRAERPRLYLDGEEVGTSSTPLTNRTPTRAFLGTLNGFDDPFHGALDELCVYERAFSAVEISAAASGQARSDQELIVMYLPFDEERGARAFDRSGLGNHAELGDGVPALMPARIERR